MYAGGQRSSAEWHGPCIPDRADGHSAKRQGHPHSRVHPGALQQGAYVQGEPTSSLVADHGKVLQKTLASEPTAGLKALHGDDVCSAS